MACLKPGEPTEFYEVYVPPKLRKDFLSICMSKQGQRALIKMKGLVSMGKGKTPERIPYSYPILNLTSLQSASKPRRKPHA